MIKAQPGKIYIILIVMLISSLLICPANSSSLPSNQIKTITFDKQKTKETIMVFLSKFPETNYFLLHNPERIVVDIQNAFVPQVRIDKETNGKAVTKVRIGQNKKNTARIVLDIEKNLEYTFKIENTMAGQNPAVKIQIYPAQNLKEPVAANLPDQPAVYETKIKPQIIPPEDRNNPKSMNTMEGENNITKQDQQGSQDIQENQGTEDLVILFNDTVPDGIFKETDTQKKSDFAVSGILQMRATYQTQEDDSIENNTSLKNRILVEAKYKKMLTVSALSDYLYFGKEDVMDDYDLDVHEAKWQNTEKNYGFSIGKQIIRWGKTDQISPVDTLNPQDMREFIIPEYEERKIPIWMADVNLFFDNFTLEGVYIPFFEESKLDYFQTNWAVFKHIKKEIQNTSLPPALKNYFNNLQIHENDPETEAEFGIRLTSTIKSIDLGLTFHHATEDIPYIKSFPVKNISVSGDLSAENMSSILSGAVPTNENIEVEYMRTNIVGFEFETTLSDFGIRGETAWQENESFLTSALTSTRKPTVTSIIGIDYTTEGDTYLNFQFAHRHIAGYSPEILYFDQDTYTLMGEINRNIFSDWLKAVLHYSKNLNNNEWYLSPQLKYTYITNLECIIGASLFSGDSDTFLGSVNNFDLVFFDISYRF